MRTGGSLTSSPAAIRYSASTRLLVDPNLALAKQAVDPAPRYGLEVPHEEVVDPLTRLLLGDCAQYHGALRRRGPHRCRNFFFHIPYLTLAYHLRH